MFGYLKGAHKENGGSLFTMSLEKVRDDGYKLLPGTFQLDEKKIFYYDNNQPLEQPSLGRDGFLDVGEF